MFAPENTLLNVGDGSWQGQFRNAETDALFEFSAAREDEQVFGPDFPSKLWVKDGFRFCRVVKTRAYVVVDEDEAGERVVETWVTKQLRRAGE